MASVAMRLNNLYDDHDSYVADTMFKDYRRKAMKIADDLYYGKSVIEKLKQAVNIGQIQRIMITARRGGHE